MRSLFIAFCLVLLTRLAGAVTPQLVSGEDFSCLLADEVGHSAVRCWDLHGHALQTPELSAPSELASLSRAVCAIDEGRVRCWQYLGWHATENDSEYGSPKFQAATSTNFSGHVEKAFAGFSEPRHLSAGPEADVCVVDRGGALHCFGEYFSPQWSDKLGRWVKVPFPSRLAARAPKLSGVRGIFLGGFMGCAITDDNRTHCWHGQDDDQYCGKALVLQIDALTDVAEVLLPRQDQGSCHSCALRKVGDQNMFSCQVGDENLFALPIAPQGASALTNPHGLFWQTKSDYAPCLLSGREPVCLDIEHETGFFVPAHNLVGGSDLATAACRANATVLECRLEPNQELYPEDGSHSTIASWEPSEYRSQVKHGMSFGVLSSLSSNLRAIARNTYKAKGDLLTRLAGVLEEEASAGDVPAPDLELFFLHAMRPLFQGTASDYVDKIVLPYVADQIAHSISPLRERVRSLADFPQETAYRRVTRKILLATAPMLQNGDDAAMSFLTALGTWDGGARGLPELKKAYTALAAVLSNDTDVQRRGLIPFLDALMKRLTS